MIFPSYTPIEPRDEREQQIVERHQRDLATQWRVIVGPLIRRSIDGKLVRLPDREWGHTFDAQVACDRYVLGRGPGRSHGVAVHWIAIARQWGTRSPDEQDAAYLRALRNEAVYLDSLRTNPPAPPTPVRRGRLVSTPVTA